MELSLRIVAECVIELNYRLILLESIVITDFWVDFHQRDGFLVERILILDHWHEDGGMSLAPMLNYGIDH